MKFKLNDFLRAVSYALDFVEMDILGVSSNHSKRVAYISLKIGEKLGLTQEELHDVVALAILHDNGASSRDLHENLSKQTKADINQLESVNEHCIIGEENIRDYPFLTNVKDVIRYHHEKYNGTGFFKIKGDRIPLSSQIIKLADTIEISFDLKNIDNESRKSIMELVKRERNKTISPVVVDAFFEVSNHTGFWMDLKDEFIGMALKKYTPEFSTDISFEGIHRMTSVLSKIIDSKSKYTLRHSYGLSKKIEHMADFYKVDDEEKMKLIIAADLHDIGKLAIPNTILEKPDKLTIDEFEIVKQHSYYTRITLQEIEGFEDITEWASNHHEKLNGSGYPYGYDKDILNFNSRLMGCLDIYQALTEERPYRNSMNHREAMSILNEFVSRGELDFRIVSDIDYVFGSRF